MSAHEAVQVEHTESASELYIAFELGEKSWKLSLGTGAKSLHGDSGRHGGGARVHREDQGALRSCPRESRVHSCYKAGRDGFWLHRWLIAQGIDNLVVDS